MLMLNVYFHPLPSSHIQGIHFQNKSHDFISQNNNDCTQEEAVFCTHHKIAHPKKCRLHQTASSLSLALFFAFLQSQALFFSFFIFLFRSLSVSSLSPSNLPFFSVKEWALIKIYLFLSVKPDSVRSHCTSSHHYAMSTKLNLLLFVLFSSVTHSLPCERSNSSTIALTKAKHAKASFPSQI